MCGILGIYSNQSLHHDNDSFNSALKLLEHRGPDSSGIYSDKYAMLGHTRLSIIDLESGNQPFISDDGNLALVYNGEVYNFNDIKRDLEKKGHRFITRCDTEVILHAYQEYGNSCVEFFNGMFAFAIHDKKKKSIFIARDRLGVKPLYYSIKDNKLFFSSEIKPLLKLGIDKSLNVRALHNYLTLSYIPTEDTLFSNILKLPPGCRMTCDSSFIISIEKYWELKERVIDMTEKECVEELKDRFTAAVDKRLIADVPLGVFLSGGIDSSAIVGVMSELLGKKVKTFSIGFGDESYNELKYSRIIAERFNTDHYEHTVEPDAFSILPKIIRHIEEPLADASVIPTYYLCEMARKNVTVALSGEGGDETFGGYTRYFWDPKAEIYQKIPRFIRELLIETVTSRFPDGEKSGFKDALRRIKKFTAHASLPASERYLSWFSLFNEIEKRDIYTDDFAEKTTGYKTIDIFTKYMGMISGRDPVKRCQYNDINTMLLDDLLLKVDKLSMAHSLEVRVPFLDHELLDFSFNLGHSIKIKGKRSKYLLKKWLADFLPTEIVNRGKKGFEVPIGSWFRGELWSYANDLLMSSKAKGRGFFRPEAVQGYLHQHKSGRRVFSNQIFALIVLELWMNEFVDC